MTVRPGDVSPDTGETLRLSLRWPGTPDTDFSDDFLLGIWHPNRAIAVELSDANDKPVRALMQGRNWSLWSSVSHLHEGMPSLLHSDNNFYVGFRGYVVSPTIHSFSPDGDIVQYWKSGFERRHNGVFCAVTIDDSHNRLSLLTDAFGFGPLYYRELNGAIAFATNPRYLTATDDKPDWLARRCRIQSGFISSDRSLSSEIQRVPAGAALCGDNSGIRVSSWFDFDSLPEGNRPITESAYPEIEEQFQTAMTRCLDIDNGKPLLPLSSGHDSRRILASLIGRDAAFDSQTVRAQQKSFRDLDATFAAEMAADFGFPHEIIDLPNTEQYVQNDRLRRVLTDAETLSHSWAISLAKALPERPTVIFDGILGDILGNPGYRMSGMYKSPRSDLDMILDQALAAPLDKVLGSSSWPRPDDLRDDIATYLSHFLHRYNIAEFAFILLRQRRSISSWSQQLIPTGHVVVCPYLDLDYVSLLLEFDPKEKHETIIQRQCLHRFCPKFARYSGNRDIPRSMPPGTPTHDLKRNLACFRAMYDELKDQNSLTETLHLLNLRKQLVVRLAKIFPQSYEWTWGAHNVFEIQARDAITRPCWTYR